MASGWAPSIHAAKKRPGFGLEHNVEKVCTDLTDLMHDSEVNFIYIASPNNLHFPQAHLALSHGKHVLCEKPLTPEKEQLETLSRLADEQGLLLLEAVPTPYLPNFQLLKKHLPRVGRIRWFFAITANIPAATMRFWPVNCPMYSVWIMPAAACRISITTIFTSMLPFSVNPGMLCIIPTAGRGRRTHPG